MPRPLLLFRVGYMESYDGPAEISSGGSHIEEYGWGGEMWNFRPEAGYCYGYVITNHFSGINLNRVLSKSVGRWNQGDESDGVDIVFIAKKPSVGQVVIGWYKNATIFHKTYRRRPNPKATIGWKKLHYLAQADENDVVLLNESERKLKIPYAPKHGYGPGHANVWYAINKKGLDKKLVDQLRKYIGSSHSNQKPTLPRKKKAPSGGGWKTPLDKKTRLAIEKASMEATERHYIAAGYIVKYVQKDNRGWDLEAKKKTETLHLEVKGHLGNVVQFELTPNEYDQLRNKHKTYRVCLVRRALEQKAVEVYEPRIKKKGWRLINPTKKSIITLGERTGARARESD